MIKYLLALVLALSLVGCEVDTSADKAQQQQQDQILKEGNAQIGMPSIKNFRERKLLKDIIEMRDQDGLVTYTYIVAEQSGKLVFLCDSIGYGIPTATQFTNPQKIEESGHQYGYAILPQADPNGLYSPTSAEGTWVMCSSGDKAVPVYIEPRIVVSPFKIGE